MISRPSCRPFDWAEGSSTTAGKPGLHLRDSSADLPNVPDSRTFQMAARPDAVHILFLELIIDPACSMYLKTKRKKPT
jgi:hypothetical protein